MNFPNFNEFRLIIHGMVAKPDLKSGFETDSNPDLTKNLDLASSNRFQIQISDQNRFEIQFKDLR